MSILSLNGLVLGYCLSLVSNSTNVKESLDILVQSAEIKI